MKRLAALVFFVAAQTAPAQQPYRQEIIENIIDPCYRLGVRTNPELVEYMSEDEALKSLKIMANSNIEQMISALSPMIPELDVTIGRERAYEMGLGACVKGLLRGPEKQSTAPAQPDFEKAAITRPTPDMMEEFRSLVENSSPYIARAGLTSYRFEGRQKIEILLMVPKSVNGPMARELGASTLAILENNWPQLEPADYLIDVMWTGNYTSSQAMDAATIAQGKRDRHESTITWTY